MSQTDRGRARGDRLVGKSENLYDPDRFGTGVGGSLFEANQQVFRGEMRAGFEVTYPASVVKITFAA